ncbi:MAG: endolytic transglycosylase MltG [Pseudomonadota bacterium]
MAFRLVIATLSLLVTLALVAVGAAYYGLERYRAPGPLAAETTIVIPRGAGLGAITGQLAEAGVIDQPLIFRLGVRASGAAQGLKAGEYRFEPGISMAGVAAVLESGKTVVRKVTVAEGLTSKEIADLVADAEAMVGEVGPPPPEGSLLPETYHYAHGDERAELIVRMTAAHDALLAELWPKRAANLPLKSPAEAVILASIVEEETGVGAERPLVASVFINRLNRGMRLQSDPTVIYGLTMGQRPLGRPLTRLDLQTGTAYNTYQIDGLPPAPIANPGRASLEAVLNPATSKFLYFVADGTGGHAFSKTLAEHNKNVQKWRKLQKQKKAAQ